jgi:hypothetical protein
MKTIEIIILIIAMFVLYMFYIDLTSQVIVPTTTSKPAYKVKEKFTNNKIENLDATTNTADKLDKPDYYPIGFDISDPISYTPDDCLPLNIMYDPIKMQILINGSGQITTTDQSLNPIITTSPISLNLILSAAGESDVDLSVPDIQFTLTQCNNNPSIQLTNNITKPISILSKFDSISGKITIGAIEFNIKKITLDNSDTLTTAFYQNPDNLKNTFKLQKICNIKKCNPNPVSDTKLSKPIESPLNAIDELIKNKKQFALYTHITKHGVPSESFNDTTLYKVYLSATFSSSDDGKPTNVKFTDKLTQGSIFNASMVKRFIRRINEPFKYLDFYNVLVNNNGDKTLQTNFYNLSLVRNKFSLTYCLQGCDPENLNGFIAQEDVNTSYKNVSKMTGNQVDNYGIKNYMKFKFESDGSVTPYFLSYSENQERIYFITNKYNSMIDDDAYKTAVQVPIYTANGPAFEMPDILVNNSIKFPTVKEVPVPGLNIPYTDDQIKSYNEAAFLAPEDTKAFLSDAYKKYALRFQIEEIDLTKIDINKLPLNEP